LNGIPGLRCARPGGAFYAFANIQDTGMTSKAAADFLLNEAGVACLSGAAFGPYGEGYVRFSYANSFENLMEAVKRIEQALVNVAASRA
jgi:aspartate/methionine/tyrosine aminotransferase